ncbi:MAG: PDZ domain-containing protein [Candidatus Pacebacteria bacterium]|nr:PDZ domain-containing protein [Candidatus Paceibacterota bacterium]
MITMQLRPTVKTFLLGLSISFLVLISFFAGAVADRVFVIKPLDYLLDRQIKVTSSVERQPSSLLGELLPGEDSFSVPDIAEAASASVVTVSIKKQQRVLDPAEQGIFGEFGFGFNLPQGELKEIQRDIGTGFVVSNDDEYFIVTNRHVVNDPKAEYLVIDKNNQEYQVSKLYRDPANDLAILQVDGLESPALPLGNSDQLRVGEQVIAIGTALGEFRHTVTTGVISGLGRGITAGNPLAGMVESIEGVIQTDAAINPGNSGGPLINIAGRVIGVNVATANAENISFAIPINVVKASIKNFAETGKFARPFLGVRYQPISEQAAILNEVPQGVYLTEIVAGSTAAAAGLQPGDIITEFADQSLKENDLAVLINQQKIGDTVTIKFWRKGEQQSVEVKLQGSGG